MVTITNRPACFSMRKVFIHQLYRVFLASGQFNVKQTPWKPRSSQSGHHLVGESLQLRHGNRARPPAPPSETNCTPGESQVGCERRVWVGYRDLILLGRRPLLVQAGRAPRRVRIPWPRTWAMALSRACAASSPVNLSAPHGIAALTVRSKPRPFRGTHPPGPPAHQSR